jgi:hypothetical protein
LLPNLCDDEVHFTFQKCKEPKKLFSDGIKIIPL